MCQKSDNGSYPPNLYKHALQMPKYGEKMGFLQVTMATQRSHTLTLHTTHTIVQTHHKAHQHVVQTMGNKCMKAHKKTHTEWHVAIDRSPALSLLKALSILDLTKWPILHGVHGLYGHNPI